MFPQIFGKYILEGEIAVGGMARVFLAKLRGAGGFEKRLVVKQIRTELASQEDFVERFVTEAKTTVELTHPNIVPVYELGVEAGVYYIAMEYCEGATLAELLQTTGPLSPSEGAYLGAEILEALDYAHRRAGVVHRDVTPRNVLVDEEGAVRLIDFGIATPVAGERARVFGSPGHMPPEQLAGKPLSPAADVFAVAALLVEAWTGRAPFRRENVQASEAALSEPLPPLGEPGLSQLSQHIDRSLSLDPSSRPKSAEEMARPLRAFTRDNDARDLARGLGAKARRVLEAKRHQGPAPTPAPELDAASSTPALPTGTRTFATRPLEGAPEPVRLSASAPRSAPEKEMSTRPLGLEGPGAQGDASESAARPAPAERRRWLFALVAAFTLVPLAFVFAGGGSEAPEGVVEPNPRLRMGEATPTARDARVRSSEVLASPAGSLAPADSIPPSTLHSTLPATSDLPKMPAPLDPRAAGSVDPGREGTTRARPDAPREEPSRARAEPSTPPGTLALTADPPAQVSVGGRTFTTPISGVHFPPGRYIVAYSHASWPRPVESAIVVVAGGSYRIHADFTLEPPRVLVR